MCGSAGIVDRGLSVHNIRPIVQQMTDALIHRGPDDEGFFVSEGVGLGMRRLSIIGAAGGSQPSATEGDLRLMARG